MPCPSLVLLVIYYCFVFNKSLKKVLFNQSIVLDLMTFLLWKKEPSFRACLRKPSVCLSQVPVIPRTLNCAGSCRFGEGNCIQGRPATVSIGNSASPHVGMFCNTFNRKQINLEKQIMVQINTVYCFLREKSTLECQSPNSPSKSQTRTGDNVRAERYLMIKFLCR